MEELFNEVVSFWGIDSVKSITKEYKYIKNENDKNVWSINNDYILKITKEEKEMKINVIMACLLAREQIPAQRVVTLKNGGLYLYHKGNYYGLFTRIKGELIKDIFKGNYLHNGYYIGSSIGWLHHGLNNITEELCYSKVLLNADLPTELKKWLSATLTEFFDEFMYPKEEEDKLFKIFDELRERFAVQYKDLPRHAIHRELRLENLLFSDDKLSGYIDFELSEINARIFDICHLSTALLTQVFEDEINRELWKDFNKELLKGYNSKVKLLDIEKEDIPLMIYEIQVVRIAYFYEKGMIREAKKAVRVLIWLYDLFNKEDYKILSVA